jgi:hypothetical protein
VPGRFGFEQVESIPNAEAALPPKHAERMISALWPRNFHSVKETFSAQPCCANE